MIKFTFEGEEYGISFQHITETITLPGLGEITRRGTIARIHRGRRKSISDNNTIAEAQASVDSRDRFERSIGCQKALRLVLQDMALEGTKGFKRAAWNAWRTRADKPFTQTAKS